MFYSEGVVGDLNSIFDHVYQHSASVEKGSSGAGVFEISEDGLVGIEIAEDPAPPGWERNPGQFKTGLPNHALMLTPDIRDNIMQWIFAPI